MTEDRSQKTEKIRQTSEVGSRNAECGKILMELRLAETVNGLNVEHRTSNFERPILMALRFTYIKTSEPHNFEGKIRLRRMLLSIFFKLTEYGIRSWTFHALA